MIPGFTYDDIPSPDFATQTNETVTVAKKERKSPPRLPYRQPTENTYPPRRSEDAYTAATPQPPRASGSPPRSPPPPAAPGGQGGEDGRKRLHHGCSRNDGKRNGPWGGGRGTDTDEESVVAESVSEY